MLLLTFSQVRSVELLTLLQVSTLFSGKLDLPVQGEVRALLTMVFDSVQ